MQLLSWLGTISSIIGAFVVALHIFFFGYVCFLIGSISWLIVGISRKDNSLITLNGVFFIANLIGLYKAIM